MRAVVVLGVVGLVALSGCASANEGVASMQGETSAAHQLSSVRVGPACLLAASVNPAAGVHVAADGNAFVVTYAHPGGLGAVERLDLLSLEPTSQTPEARSDASPAPEVEAQRVDLEGGRFLMVWKSGDAEHGYRAMAQAFNDSDRSPRGAPVIISPFGADVSGPLSVATSGAHVVAALAASTAPDRSFVAYAVPLEAL